MSEQDERREIVEALIFASSGPVNAGQLRRAIAGLTSGELAGIVKAVNEELAKEGRPYAISEIAGGYQFRTRPEFAESIRAMQPERKLRLSRPALETLAVIAYKQPITRAEIEDLRCVDCGAVIKSLLDRSLARIVGRRDAPGRPVLYGTSANFLETFGLKSLAHLPDLRQIDALDEEQEGTPVERLAQSLGASDDEGSLELPLEDAPAEEKPAEEEAEDREPEEPTTFG